MEAFTPADVVVSSRPPGGVVVKVLTSLTVFSGCVVVTNTSSMDLNNRKHLYLHKHLKPLSQVFCFDLCLMSFHISLLSFPVISTSQMVDAKPLMNVDVHIVPAENNSSIKNTRTNCF